MQGKHVARTGMYRLRHVQSLTDSTEFFYRRDLEKRRGITKARRNRPILNNNLNEIKDMGDPSYKGSFRKFMSARV